MAKEVFEVSMNKQKLSADDAGTLVLITAIIFGAWFRIMPSWMAGFPINDGGMFYTMIKDLQGNHYIPPLFTTYNHLNIPYVYPPLGFYLGVFITDLLKLTSPLPVIQWLPGILNALCIPAFYFFTKEVLTDKLKSALATLVYSLIPFTTVWHSMGGGLTRALGTFFMLIALAYIHRVFTKESKKDIWGAIVFCGLAGLSHIEAPVYTLAIAIYIWMMKSHSRKGFVNALLIAIGVLVLSAPWYGWVIYQHGFTPLISASQSGFHTFWSALELININFVTSEPYLTLLGVTGILGMATLVARKSFFIPGMLIVVYISQPRSAATIGNIPLAMAAGVFIFEVLLPAITKMHGDENQLYSKPRRSLALFLIVIIPYLLSNSIYYGFRLSEMHVSKAKLAVMQWIANNTPSNSTFLIITGETNGFCDSTSEWFPALTNRQSLDTLQGNEWLRGKYFGNDVVHLQKLQACSKEGLACVLQEANYFKNTFDYLFISVRSPTLDCKVVDDPALTRAVLMDLENSPLFQSVFRSEDALIFTKR
jgi:hypothetical protein